MTLQDGTRLVKLRNPWGKGEWKGDWSDNSNLWTPQLRQQLAVAHNNDGIFFMNYEDFLRYFDGVSICHYRDEYILSSLQDANKADSPAVYQFELTHPGEYYFGFSQPDKNLYPDNCYEYGYLSLVLIKMEGSRPVYLGGVGKPTRDGWLLSKKIQPGNIL